MEGETSSTIQSVEKHNCVIDEARISVVRGAPTAVERQVLERDAADALMYGNEK